MFFNKDIIKFIEPFTEKYTLSIKTNIKTGNMPIKTEAIIRWELKVKSINENSLTIELLKLDDLLLDDSGNQIVKNIAELSQLFNNMFKEIEVVINDKYKITKLLNPEIIRKKWEWTRKDITRLKEQEKILAQVIKLNDDQFSEDANIIDAIEKSEFFKFYFNQLYGHKFNSTSNIVQKKNYANTTYLDWKFFNEKKSETEQYIDFTLDGELETKINKDWVKKAYEGFSHLDLDKLKPQFEEKGKYRIDKKTGKLLIASLTSKEIIDPNLLFFEYNYTLKSDSYQKKSPKKENPTVNRHTSNQNFNSPFIVDE